MEDGAKDKPNEPGATPPASAEGSEDSGMPVTGSRAVLRIGFIGLVALGTVLLGSWLAGPLPGLPDPLRAFRGRKAPSPDLPQGFRVLSGDRAVASDPVFINGREYASARFVSERPAATVIMEYAASLRKAGFSLMPGRGGRGRDDGNFIRFSAEGQAMLAARDLAGRFLGIVAFENPGGAGCSYLVTRDPEGSREEPRVDGDIRGTDPPGVVRPPASVREYCVERKTPSPSVLSLYWSEATAGMVEEIYRARMAEKGWSEPEEVRPALEGRVRGRQICFRRGGELCMVQVDAEETRERGCWVTLMYRRRPR